MLTLCTQAICAKSIQRLKYFSQNQTCDGEIAKLDWAENQTCDGEIGKLDWAQNPTCDGEIVKLDWAQNQNMW